MEQNLSNLWKKLYLAEKNAEKHLEESDTIFTANGGFCSGKEE